MSSPKESQISQQSHGELLADTVLYRDRDPYLGRDSLESLQDALLQGQHFRETIEELYTQSTPGGGNPSWDAEQFESQNIYWSSEGFIIQERLKQEVLALRDSKRTLASQERIQIRRAINRANASAQRESGVQINVQTAAKPAKISSSLKKAERKANKLSRNVRKWFKKRAY